MLVSVRQLEASQDARACAVYGCANAAVWVETREGNVGGRKWTGFYVVCDACKDAAWRREEGGAEHVLTQ